MTASMEEKFQELMTAKSVRGVFIMTTEGALVKSSLDAKETETFAKAVRKVAETVKESFSEIDTTNDAPFLKVKLRKYDLMIAQDKNYIMTCIYSPPVM